MSRLRLQRTALGTRLRSLRERPLEGHHFRATIVLVAGLALAAAGFAALGPSLGAFTAQVSSQAEVGAGSLDLALNAPSGQPTCSANAAEVSVTCSNAYVTTAAAPGQEESVDWQAQSSGTITPQNDPGFSFSLTPGSCTGSNSTICSDTEVTVDEWAAQPNVATVLPATSMGIVNEAVTCPSVTVCVAVGRSFNGDFGGLAMVSSDGGATWSAPVLVPGSTMLRSVSCPSVSTCVAVGYDGSSAGVVSVGTAPSTAGDPWSWTTAVDVTGTTGLQWVDCPSSTECVAVGANSAGVGVAVSSSDGGSSWSSPQTLSGTTFSLGVTCPSTTTCLAVTQGASSGEAFVGAESSSGSWTWTTTSALALPSGDFVYSLDCPSSTACLGSGTTLSEGLIDTLDYSSTSSSWSWGTPQAIAGTSTFSEISCTSTSDCVAVGGAPSGTPDVTVATTDGGTTWSAPDAPSGPTQGFRSVACASRSSGSSTCVAVSFFHSATSTDGGQSWVGYQPISCVYPLGQSNNTTCTFSSSSSSSSSDTLASLRKAGQIPLQPSTVADPGVLIEVSTELASSALPTDESATARVTLSFEVSS
jgi:hypothetical protein